MIFTAPNEGDVYLLYTIGGWKLGLHKCTWGDSKVYLIGLTRSGAQDNICVGDDLAVKVGKL